MTEEIYKRIEIELKKNKITKKTVAIELGYKNTSGLTNALKRGVLRLRDFVKIADMLNIHPMDFFPRDTKINIYDMTLYDVIRAICEKEVKEMLEKNGK